MRLALGFRLCFFLALAILSPTFAAAHKPAQDTKRKPIEVPTIAPRPEDVATVDGLIKAFYETISGPAGQPRQWGRDRTLYVPGVRFVSTGVGRNGKPYAVVSSHQEYVDAVNDAFVRDGFFEHEIHRATRTYGNITHVWSTYESRLKADGPVTARGINSVELFYDGQRWWIATATWADETPQNPIPKEYLP